MQDRKYAAIQFTIKDFDFIKSIQVRLNKELGLKLSLAQTVMYCAERVGRLQTIKDRLEQYEEASEGQKPGITGDSQTHSEPLTGDQPMLRIQSFYLDNQNYNGKE